MASSFDPRVRRLIVQEARRRGLDPEAVLSVASGEGGVRFGAVGDHGTSFGPFQLHMGGALPAKYGHSAAAARAFANSPAGIRYAEDRIAGVARGLHGKEAVAAIVRGFERPAAPGPEIERAFSRYGSFGSKSVSGGAGGGLSSSAGSGIGGFSGGTSTQAAVVAQLLADSQATLAGQQPDFGSILALSQLGQAPDSGGGSPAAPRRVSGGSTAAPGGHIRELFYDPLGGVKNDQQIGAIGGHRDHVHVALSNPRAQRVALQHAAQLGLHISEDGIYDTHVDPVHVKTSYHYKIFKPGGRLREAADVSGDPRKMAAYYRWVESHF